MRLKSAEFRNFASYGNKTQRIDFSDLEGMFYLIVGENGTGKSTLSDIIKFGAYGKLGNKRLRDIPNRFNGGAYVKLELESKNKNVIIERGISPGFLNLTVNGIPYDQAGKKNAEEYIEEEILGMPFYVFNNIISLSINDFKSFLSMSPHDKRMIIDKIFGLEILNVIRWMLKDELKKIRDNSLSLLKESEAIEATITNSEKELDNLKHQIETDSEETRKGIIAKIQAYSEKLEEIKIRLDEIQLKNSSCSIKISDLTDILQTNKQDERTINEKKKLYENQKCPLCESDLQTDFHQTMFKEYLEKEMTVKENIDKAKEEIVRLKNLKVKITDTIIHFESKKAEFTTVISNFNRKIKELDETKDTSLQTKTVEKIINESKKRKVIVVKNKDREDNKGNFFKILEDVYGDKGVKQLAINKILPTLNSEIRRVLADLRMDYRVVFNQNFEAEVSHLGYEVATPQLSTGERKKIDFAVLIALIRLLKIKFPTTNIIFLDEIFSSIDADGIFHILKILSATSKELKMNIFVVNHAPLPEELFDCKIDIKKLNNFSSLEIHKLN
jgi:DNA repair exonuclease SbcCD ATPase subunit